jgi:hypothetical protein
MCYLKKTLHKSIDIVDILKGGVLWKYSNIKQKTPQNSVFWDVVLAEENLKTFFFCDVVLAEENLKTFFF